MDITWNKAPESPAPGPKVRYQIPTIVIATILITVACVTGNSIHKHRTPPINGTYVAGTSTRASDLPAADCITISGDKTLSVSRSFKDPGTGEEVVIAGKGKVKEKKSRYLLKIDLKSTAYQTSTTLLKKNGKAIPARKLMDKRMYVKKEELKSGHVAIYYRNRDKKAKTKWVRQPASNVDS